MSVLRRTGIPACRNKVSLPETNTRTIFHFSFLISHFSFSHLSSDWRVFSAHRLDRALVPAAGGQVRSLNDARSLTRPLSKRCAMVGIPFIVDSDRHVAVDGK